MHVLLISRLFAFVALVTGAISVDNDDERVRIIVYGESFCPDTTAFLESQLLTTYRDELTDYMSVKYVPFGKAECWEVNGEVKCRCQHGDRECENNAIQNCVIKRLPRTKHHLPIVACLQHAQNIQVGTQCPGLTNDDLTCGRGNEGKRLLLDVAQTPTKATNLTYVPWIVVNGQRSNKAEYALKDVICEILWAKGIYPNETQCPKAYQPRRP